MKYEKIKFGKYRKRVENKSEKIKDPYILSPRQREHIRSNMPEKITNLMTNIKISY